MMTRLFPTAKTREIVSLDGPWTFAFPPAGTTVAPDADLATLDTRALAVPGVWEQELDKRNYRGQALAERTFDVTAPAWIRLVFAGVSHTVRVFVNGREVGFHHNAYTPFAVEAGRLEPGRHKVRLHISNEHGEISALHVPNDYYNYGGISRPVELHAHHAPVLVDHLHAVPQPGNNGSWELDVTAQLRHLGDDPWSGRLRLAVGGAEAFVAVSLEPRKTTVETVTLTVADVTPWSPATPRLYALRAELHGADGAVIDDKIERVGFRTVAVKGSEILLNGEPVYLLGFCRHEDHPDHGCALPVEVMRQDLALMRDMGANAVRTTHYPNDQRFLDLCDEQGILVWEENHARGLFGEGERAMTHPRFRAQCAAVNEEMVTWHFNHPSIIMWGILNECDSFTDYGRSRYAEQFDQLRALDASRPVTYASCHYANDQCQDLPDICGWNRYARWYSSETPGSDLDTLVARFTPRGLEDKPMILSEFGAGAIPGFRDLHGRVKWSEDRQVDILDETLRDYLAHERLCGLFIWQFCDCRVDESWAMQRPRCQNNKGIVDGHRRPKLAYATVRDHYRAAARHPQPR